MKIAIVHDYIKEYGGAERVLESLCEVFPDAQVYTLIYLPSFLGPHRKRFSSWRIKTSIAQLFPFKAKLISPLRIIAPLLFRGFSAKGGPAFGWDFSKFDAVIVSATGAYSPNIINHKSAIHISYVHTPPRYLYGYATARDWKKNIVLRVLGEIANHFLRLVDYKAAQNVDYFIANSENVRQRIQKFYRRDAKVIYPPVDTVKGLGLAASMVKGHGQTSDKNLTDTGSDNETHRSMYYLAGGRIAKPKHVDLIVKTFEELDLPLKVFGRTFGGLNISISKYPNIQFLGEVSDEEKFELMRNAKAYIFAAEDEDFGITPVEAMNLGTPVIAYRSGGVIESIIEDKTGIFFDELSVKSLKNAIERFSKLHFDREFLIRYAGKFSKERFKHEIINFVNSKVSVKGRSAYD